MMNWLKKNELFNRIFVLVILATISVCLITSLVVFQRSRQAYITSYEESNTIILEKIQEDYERLNQQINQIFDKLSTSNVVTEYLSEPTLQVHTIMQLKKELEDTKIIAQNTPTNLVLIGTNGRSFFQNDGVRIEPIEQLLNNENIRALHKDPALSQYFFQKTGLTTTTQHDPGLLYIRKIQSQQHTIGYALIFVTEKNFAKIYHELLDEQLHTVFIVNHEGTILSSSNKPQLGQAFNLENLQKIPATTLHEVALYSYDFTFYDQIDEKFLTAHMNLLQPTILIALISIVFAAGLSFIMLRKITSPIYHLIEKIPAVTKGDFSHKVTIEGPYETQELGKAYNLMLNNLEQYIHDLLTAEKEKHLLEIRSLQMQIHPHFMYNTLTALKFLIWKNEQEKASIGIESFIYLLQQTFNNKEFLTLKEEIQLTESYMQLMTIRYGDQIQTSLFIAEDCENYLVPKLIIQPIIENAYLHAFPEQQNGYIQIFANVSQERLKIEIIDNGVGFNQPISEHASDQSNHYSGIGLKNIDERIKLIYGAEFGLFTHSEPNEGTMITLWLPLRTD